MVHPDPQSSGDDRDASASEKNPAQSAPVGPPAIASGMMRVIAVGCLAGLIAGLVSSVAGESIMNHYQSDLSPPVKNNPSPEEIRVWKQARLYSAVTTYTTMGGLLGLAMGLAGGLARRSVAGSVCAAILGLLLGSIVTASLSVFVVSVFYKHHDPHSNDLLLPLLAHGAMWSAMGAIGGLAFGLGLGGHGRWKATVVGGLMGAAAATVIYEIVGALVFPINKTDLPLSSSMMTRGMAQLLVAILSAVGAVVALRGARGAASSSVAT